MANSPAKGRSIIERPSTAILFLLVIFLIGMGVGAILGKLRPPPPPQPTNNILIHPSTDPTVFKDGDRIQIYYSDLSNPGSEVTKVYTVDDKGTIPIPRLGALMARGHTAAQLEEAISKKYREQGLYTQMRIEITRPK